MAIKSAKKKGVYRNPKSTASVGQALRKALKAHNQAVTNAKPKKSVKKKKTTTTRKKMKRVHNDACYMDYVTFFTGDTYTGKRSESLSGCLEKILERMELQKQKLISKINEIRTDALKKGATEITAVFRDYDDAFSIDVIGRRELTEAELEKEKVAAAKRALKEQQKVEKEIATLEKKAAKYGLKVVAKEDVEY